MFSICRGNTVVVVVEAIVHGSQSNQAMMNASIDMGSLKDLRVPQIGIVEAAQLLGRRPSEERESLVILLAFKHIVCWRASHTMAGCGHGHVGNSIWIQDTVPLTIIACNKTFLTNRPFLTALDSAS